MLLFYNHKIYFNFEVNQDDNFYATCLPCCANKDIGKYFSNVHIFESYNAATLAQEEESRRILLSPQEYRGFIEAWCNNISVRKIYSWDGASFFMEYVNMLKQIAEIDAQNQFDGRWEGDDGLYDNEKINIINNLKVSSIKPSPIIINNLVEPELSIKIEDAIAGYLEGKPSIYTTEINNLIDYNIRRIKLSKSLYDNFSKTNSILKPDIDLSDNIKINNIDYKNPNCIFYFYYYSFLPGVKTNLIHLQKVLKVAKERI